GGVSTSRARRSLVETPDRDEPDQVRDADHEASRLGVDPQPGVEGQANRDRPEALVPASPRDEILLVRHAEDPKAAEQVNAVDRSLAAIEWDPILADDPRGVVAVAHLDDVRVQIVRG